VLAEEPLCRSCREAGLVAVSTIVDHIKPLSEGGSDDRSNKQGLCEPCHLAKSKAERARAARRRVG
jgi:5-methylcytosine-specific restriction protein A